MKSQLAQAVVLAAGYGSRLQPLTQIMPKPLIPVWGTALIKLVLRRLHRYGLTKIVINTHHLGDQIQACLGSGAVEDLQINYSPETQLLGTGGALQQMEQQLSDLFVLHNSDIIFEVDLQQVLAYHQAADALVTLIVHSVPPQQARIFTDQHHHVVSLFTPKAAQLQPFGFTGIAVIAKRFLTYLPNFVPNCWLKDGLTAALAAGERILAYPAVSQQPFCDAGTPAAYFQLHCQLLKIPYAGIPLPSMLKPIRQNSYSWGTPILNENVACHGTVFIGDRVIVGDNVVLEDCLLLDAVEIAAKSNIKRCILFPGGELAF